jgi:endonuclease III
MLPFGINELSHFQAEDPLQLCAAADEPWLWDLLDLVPTPAHTALLLEDQVQRVLKAHRIRRITAQEVLTCLQALALPVAPGTAEAAQAHCQFLLPCLRVLAEQLQACSQQVSALLSTLAEAPGKGEGPSDVAMVLSLPGVGRKITAWLFAEAAQSLARARLSKVAHARRGRSCHEAKWQTSRGGDAPRV